MVNQPENQVFWVKVKHILFLKTIEKPEQVDVLAHYQAVTLLR